MEMVEVFIFARMLVHVCTRVCVSVYESLKHKMNVKTRQYISTGGQGRKNHFHHLCLKVMNLNLFSGE